MIAYILQDRLITFAFATWTAFILVGCYNMVVNSKWYVRHQRMLEALKLIADMSNSDIDTPASIARAALHD